MSGGRHGPFFWFFFVFWWMNECAVITNFYFVFAFAYIYMLFVRLPFHSPWYDLRGWLGVKQQLSIYLSFHYYRLIKTSVFLTNPAVLQGFMIFFWILLLIKVDILLMKYLDLISPNTTKWSLKLLMISLKWVLVPNTPRCQRTLSNNLLLRPARRHRIDRCERVPPRWPRG